MTPSSSPMRTEPTPSQTELSVTVASPSAASAMSRPTSAPESSSSSTGSSGALEPRMNCGHDAPSRSGLDSWMAVRKLEASSTAATRRMAMAHPVDSRA